MKNKFRPIFWYNEYSGIIAFWSDEDDKVEEEAHSEEEEEEEEEFDWHVEQQPYKEKELLLDGQTYGFANQKSGIFKRLQVCNSYVN